MNFPQFDGMPPFGPPPMSRPPMNPPPYGPPSFGPPPMGQPPYGPPPFGPPPMGQQPMGPPPNFSPPIPAWHGGSQGIRSCLFRYTYIWLDSGRSFWFFPTFVGRETVSGYRWSRRNGWSLRAIRLDNIRSFQCF